jgi:UDP-GlcNAc:undecaprenyl-phosphate GlcNAc-1-phosphate transferase
MYSILFLGVLSFLLALVLTPLVRNRFRQWGMVDRPDAERKHHDHPVPRVGGIPLLVAYLCSLGLLAFTPLSAGALVADALPFALRLLPAVLLIFATGLLDDLVSLKPWQKLAGQLAAAGAAYWAGVHVQAFGGHHFAAWWSMPLTLLWLVLCTNAVNLIDGVDGLAAGVGLFAAFTMLLAALLGNNFPLAIATVPLVGCLLGFLRYNFNPATIFLGDSGSLFVGFLLGCYGVLWSQKSATILGMTAPLMALSIPLLDTALAIVRRFLRNKSIFAADRGHIHHRLLDRGLTPRKVALIFYALCSVAAVFSLCMASHHFEGLVILLFCAATWIGIQHLGYVELGVAGRMFLEGAFRRMLSSQISLQQYQQLLADAATPQECWAVIETAAREFGLEQARMELSGYYFEYRHEPATSCAWEVSIPLSEFDSVALSARATETSSAAVVAPFASMLHRTLSSKLASFDSQPQKAAAASGD